MKLNRKRSQLQKLNLIPILDAVFIFIFFLLMSAQFLEIYEIGSDAPAVQEIETEKNEDIPLNLKLSINTNGIEVRTGLDGIVYRTISLVNGEFDLKTLKETLIELKRKNIEEESIIIGPQDSIPYNKIVSIIDIVREVKPDEAMIVGTNKKGKEIQTKKLFSQVIFETII